MNKPNSRHNVLILINVRWWNATAFYAVNIARLLQKNGHGVFIGCNPAYPAFSMAKQYGIRTVPLNFYGFNPITLFKSLCRMIHLIRSEKITIINSHRSEDHTFALIAKRLTGVKCVVTRGDQRAIGTGALSAWRYRLCDAVIVTCRSIIDQNPHIFGSLGHKTSVIYGCVDEDHFVAAGDSALTLEKYKMDRSRKIIGLIGRLSWVKDPFTLVKAAQLVLEENQDAHFLIAGNPVDITADEIRDTLRRLDIEDYFTLLPQIDDIADVMNILDISVIISISSETISRVLLEYMYLGKPVIGTRINAIGETIRPGFNGLLIAPENPQALANAVLTLLNDDKKRGVWGDNSRRLYQTVYSEEIFYTQYMDVFDSLV